MKELSKENETAIANRSLDKETCTVAPAGITRRDFLASAATATMILSAGPVWMLGNKPALAAEEKGLLEKAFFAPPDSAKVWAYWWWLDGAASKEGITRDLEAMKQEGIAGVLVFDAGTGGAESPKGPEFMSDEWRERFRHAVQEAGRLGIEMGINVCSGWDAGGPWVEREDAIKAFVWSETLVEGPADFDGLLRQPELAKYEANYGLLKEPQDWYRDLQVIGGRTGEDGVWSSKQAVDLTSATAEGRLKWRVPEGKWTILRLGYRMTQARIKLSSDDRGGWEIDPLSAQALDRHFAKTAAKLIEDAGPLAGRTLKYTHIDSWEVGQPTWTAAFVEEFRSRRGYDPMPYLPALANRIVNGHELTKRFLWDYRRTLADLVAENYYGRLTKLSHDHGMGTHSEAGGPFFSHYIDGLECVGADDIPMGEFWANRILLLGDTSPSPNPKDEGTSTPFFQSGVWRPVSADGNDGCVRQAATAAHIYGKELSQAESYTNFADDWTEDPYFLKPFGDRAFCLGLTRQMLCFSVLQSELNAKPGYEWAHVGTHFDRNITWWEKSHAWLTYLARCQYMLRQGLFAADVLYFYGETIPNFALIDRKPLSGYDFDTINAQVLLTRASAQDGHVVLPDGMKYRYLVIPEGAGTEMTVTVLQKISELVKGGVTLLGLPPKRSPGLTNYPACDEQLKQLSDALWGADIGSSGMRTVGKGRVIWGKGLDEVVKADGLSPDVELRALPKDAKLDWIHRHSVDGDLYFLANGTENAVEFEASFRVENKVPELWDAVTGEIRDLPQYHREPGRTAISMRLEPAQSFFVVFRKDVPKAGKTRGTNFPTLSTVASLSGSWEIAFDPAWGGPAKITFNQLEDWTKRSEEGIRFYSGTATYRKTFDLPQGVREPLYLDLGSVKNVAQVRLNGKDLGVVWTAPWRVAIGGVVREKGNELEIEVVNLWPNRLIGDGKLPKDQRRTVTNVHTYDAVLPKDYETWGCPVCDERRKTGREPELLSSGLLGPVTLQREV